MGFRAQGLQRRSDGAYALPELATRDVDLAALLVHLAHETHLHPECAKGVGQIQAGGVIPEAEIGARDIGKYLVLNHGGAVLRFGRIRLKPA